MLFYFPRFRVTMGPIQVMPYMDRLDYMSAMANAHTVVAITSLFKFERSFLFLRVPFFDQIVTHCLRLQALMLTIPVQETLKCKHDTFFLDSTPPKKYGFQLGPTDRT